MHWLIVASLLTSFTMNVESTVSTREITPRKRCAFAISDGSNDTTKQQNKRQRQKVGGLCHTAPALGGPIGAPELTVLTTKDSNVIRRWLEENNVENKSGSYSILGFDIESIAKPPWMPDRASLPDGPATIQLATPNSCLLVQLSRCGDGSAINAPSILRDVINNPNIIKVGVGIDDDALELYRWSKYSNSSRNTSSPPILWEMTSRFDIGCILPSHNPGRRIGIRELAKTILGVEIEKNKKLQMSNWGKKYLTRDQISYAARDAWVSAAVLKRLQRDNMKTFGAKELLEKDFMTSQRNLKDMDERAVMRKNAKVEYKALVEKEKESGIKCDEKRIEELNEALKFYRPDPPPSFEEEDFVLPFY